MLELKEEEVHQAVDLEDQYECLYELHIYFFMLSEEKKF